MRISLLYFSDSEAETILCCRVKLIPSRLQVLLLPMFRGSNLVQVSCHIIFLLLVKKGVQNRLPQDMLFWHVIYFELRQLRSWSLRRNVSPKYLEQPKCWALPHNKSYHCKSYHQKQLLWPIYRAGQTSNYWTSVLLILLWMTFHLSEVPYLILSSE